MFRDASGANLNVDASFACLFSELRQLVRTHRVEWNVVSDLQHIHSEGARATEQFEYSERPNW